MASIGRTVIAWIYTIVFWTITFAFLGFVLKFLSNRINTKIIQFWGKTTLWILGIQVELENSSTVSDLKARIVICNHQSALDILWGAFICPANPLVIGKKEVIFIPILNIIWWVFNFIRIDRGNPKKAILALNQVSDEVVKNSRSLVIAPEGTRTKDGSILPFKKGAFHLALNARVPICPIVVSGAFELLPRHRFFPKPGKIRIRFLPPIDTQGLSVDGIDRLIDRTRSNMIQALEGLKSTV